MKIDTVEYKIAIILMIMSFICYQPLFANPQTVPGAEQIDTNTKETGHTPAEFKKRESQSKEQIDKMNIMERIRRFRGGGFLNSAKLETPAQTEGSKWQKFDDSQETAIPRGWYDQAGETCKKTSTTGKGPLWAKVATAITHSKTERGEDLYGVKLKL